jgi:uncharacterized protein YneF (UPF0154 family)
MHNKNKPKLFTINNAMRHLKDIKLFENENLDSEKKLRDEIKILDDKMAKKVIMSLIGYWESINSLESELKNNSELNKGELRKMESVVKNAKDRIDDIYRYAWNTTVPLTPKDIKDVRNNHPIFTDKRYKNL